MTNETLSSLESNKETIIIPEMHYPSDPFDALSDSMLRVLRTYSNVHRGSGFYSTVTTHLFEKAREIVLEYLSLNPKKYLVIFCTPYRVKELIKQLKPE
jgi:selenocysteine lyase/cysteine desulfurase